MWLIVLLVLFTVVMGLWGFSLHGSSPIGPSTNWLAFAACLILGLVVFLTGTGTIVWTRGP